MRVLYLSPRLPWPPRDGASIDSWWCLNSICWNGHRADLIAFAPAGTDAEEVKKSAPGLERVALVPGEPRRQSPRALIRSLLRGSSYLVEKYSDGRYARTIRRYLQTESYDAIVLDRPYPGAGLMSAAQGQPLPPVTLRAQNVESDLLAMEATRHAGVLRWLLRRDAVLFGRFEASVAALAGRVCAITSHDARRLGELCHRDVDVLPAFLEVEAGTGPLWPGDAGTVVCTGDFLWRPNRRGVQWFLEEVWPRVRLQVPGARFVIAGRSAGRLGPMARAGGVVVHEDVADMSRVLARAHIVVAPVLEGSGVRIKVLEALAIGRRVLTTSVGASGIDYQGIRIEQGAGAWRDALGEELQRPPRVDPDAVAYVKREHDWRRSWSPLGNPARVT